MAEDVKQYQITIRKKFPYLSKFLFGAIWGSFILGLYFTLFKMDFTRFSHYPTPVSTNVIWTIFCLAIGFVLFRYLYKRVIIIQGAFLNFTLNEIIIKTKKTIYQIPILEIENIKLIDPTDLDDFPKGKFFVIIYQVNSKTMQFQLNEYSDADSFIDNLLKYDTLKNHIKSPERLNEPDIITEDD